MMQTLSQWKRLFSNACIMLTLDSTVEALAESLMSEDDRRADFSDEVLRSMKLHLRAWNDDMQLRERMLNHLGYVKQRKVPAFLAGIAKAGIVDTAHVATWNDLRNSVMHGKMVEPWATEESDGHMNDLIHLVHRLTEARIRNESGVASA